MNKKRKILTLVALTVFGLIIFFHYYRFNYRWEFEDLPGIHDVRMPLFVLAVFYAGLFFLFGAKDAEPVPRRPRNWRRIIGVILAGLVVASLIAAIIYSQDVARRSERSRRDAERSRRDAIEVEDSRHRIKSSEIDLIDLQLEPRFGRYNLIGRIRNRSAHNSTLSSITLMVTLREKEGSPDILGVQTAQIRVEVPPHQTRAISADHPLPQFAPTYAARVDV